MNELRILAEVLLSRAGTGAFALGLGALLGYLVLQRWRQAKRLTYQIQANSRVGLVPAQPGTGEHGQAVRKVLRTLRHVSVVVIRFANDGYQMVAPADYDRPITLRFPGRYILDFRITGARPQDPLRQRVLSESRVSRIHRGEGDPPEYLGLDEIREDIERALSGQLSEQRKKGRQQLTLPMVDLKPGDEFFLLLDLHEVDPDQDTKTITKDWEIEGEVRSGRQSVPLVDALQRGRRFRRVSVAAAVALFLAGVVVVLVLNQVIRPFGGVACSSGTAQILGSTAFEPEIRTIVGEYQARCGWASITVAAQGTEAGIRQLNEARNASEIAAIADGRPLEAENLQFTPVAIVTSAVVVNSDVGVNSLSMDQLRGIYAGRYVNWRQLGAADLPIRLISRIADSGTRTAFERNVLHASEPGVTSNSCLVQDRQEKGPAIRCERAGTADLLDAVERTPGAIGYADAVAAAKHNSVVRLRLDGTEPTSEYLDRGYPFWTVERLYTKGVPASDSLLKRFIDYLSTDTVKARLREAGYVPCVQAQGTILPLCQSDH